MTQQHLTQNFPEKKAERRLCNKRHLATGKREKRKNLLQPCERERRLTCSVLNLLKTPFSTTSLKPKVRFFYIFFIKFQTLNLILLFYYVPKLYLRQYVLIHIWFSWLLCQCQIMFYFCNVANIYFFSICCLVEQGSPFRSSKTTPFVCDLISTYLI